jgi:signal transduction histidine kinase
VLISKRELEELSEDIRKIIDGQNIDIRNNQEGALSILKNDIHTLAVLKSEQFDAARRDRDKLKDVLADISHQLKTPLTSMMIMADLLEGAPPEKQSEFIANIKTGLVQTEWLVSSLLKIAKLDAGTIEFSPEPVCAEELAVLALDPLKILLDMKNQQVVIKGECELYCDKRWTAEALTNVIKNASEYSPEGGMILIESGANPISAWIGVTDSGSGIRTTDVTNLFKRFEGSRSDKGYGIGLPLALAIMQSQNGDIEVDGGGQSAGATLTLKLFM